MPRNGVAKPCRSREPNDGPDPVVAGVVGGPSSKSTVGNPEEAAGAGPSSESTVGSGIIAPTRSVGKFFAAASRVIAPE